MMSLMIPTSREPRDDTSRNALHREITKTELVNAIISLKQKKLVSLSKIEHFHCKDLILNDELLTSY